MPASTTTAAAPKKPTFSDIKINNALDKASKKVCEELKETSFAEVAALACKMMTRAVREELKL